MTQPQIWFQLSQAIQRYRESKGFETATWDTAGTRFACVAAEIWEVEEALLEADDAESLEHVRMELAGIITYVVGLQMDLGLELGTQRTRIHKKIPHYATPADLTQYLRSHWRAAFEAWRRADRKETAVALEILVCAVKHLRNSVLQLPGDLIADCLKILEDGATRPYRHGGKHPLT